MSEVTINGEKYASIEDYLDSIKQLPEGAGKRFSKTKEYNDGTKTAWIPAGFTVSGIKNETTIDGGLVIYDIPENELENIKWDETEKTKYNQFVWIPVEVNKATDTETSIASFYRSEWSNNARTTGLSSNITEPNATNDTVNKTGIASQIENLTKSIYKYGGFYIGRYEAGSETERTSAIKATVTPIGIKQDMYPYNYVKWGDDIDTIGTVGAVYLSNSLYNSSDYGATSMLCTGACWDSMLDFIKDKEHNVTSSAIWGNYYNSDTYKVYRGMAYSNSAWSSANATNGTEITQNRSILLTTGATERNSAKNIYDVAGNCDEWTTESGTSGNRVLRGGSCCKVSGYGNISACYRGGSMTSYSSYDRGFRVSLYVNL